MTKGYTSLRELEALCKTDIRFMYLLRNENSTPTHMTFSNFINNYLKCSIEEIFYDINQYIFEKDNVNTDIAYIDWFGNTFFEHFLNRHFYSVFHRGHVPQTSM